MRNLLLQFQKQNHKLFLLSTNGKNLLQRELLNRLDRKIATPDIDICYTLPRNFKSRFKKGSRLKMAIYNYETEFIPKKWVNEIRRIDYALPSSNFSKEVFVNSGWPDKKCVVIPHGINPEDYLIEDKLELHSSRSFKFLNISIPHYRKNIDVLLDAYYSAFSNEDDVVLVLKTKLEVPNRKLYRFEVDVKKQIMQMQKKHMHRPGGLPVVEVIQDRLPSMVPLYNACDVVVSATSTEGFGMPLLEGLAAGNLVIAPRCTGQLDFLNDKNSLLADVKMISAGTKYQYWEPTKGAKTYLPIVDSLSDAMLNAYNNRDDLLSRFKPESDRICKEFTWENAAKKILDLS